MTWGRQVVHVARKDLHQARWFVAAYILVIGAMGTSIAAWPRFGGPPQAGPIFIAALFVLVVGMLVQADSPSRVDAFWATRPLYPSAVAAAKALAAVVALILPGLAAQAVIVFVYRTAPADVLHAVRAQLAAEGILLALILPAAALTRDLRTFVVALVLLVFGGLCAYSLRESTPAPMEVTPALAVMVPAAWVALLLGLFLYEYRTRNTRRGWVAGVALAAFYIASPPFTAATVTSAPPESARVAIDSVTQGLRMNDMPALQLWLGIRGRQPDDRLIVSPVAVRLRHLDGRRDSAYAIPRVTADQPRLSLPPYHWFSVDRALVAATLPPRLLVSDQQLADLAAGRLVVRTSATVLVQRPVLAATLPLEAGATAQIAGARIEVRGIQDSPGGLIVRFQSLAFNSGHSFGPQALTFALVNDVQKEAVELSNTWGSGESIGLSLTSLSMLLQRQDLSVRRQSGRPETRRIDAAWLRDARLAVFAWRDWFSARLDQTIDSASVSGP